MTMPALAVITAALDLTPKIVDVGKDVWKKLKPPDQLAKKTENNGISGNTYYSDDHKFQISLPDNNWRFWLPTSDWLRTANLSPTQAMPMMIFSNNMVRLFRPNVNIVVDDVGSNTNIKEITDLSVLTLQQSGFSLDENNIKIFPNTNSASVVAAVPWFKNSPYQATKYTVQLYYLYGSRAYFITASYVPVSDASPGLFGGMQDILNSFKIIKSESRS
jgi:hypothetical protein